MINAKILANTLRLSNLPSDNLEPPLAIEPTEPLAELEPPLSDNSASIKRKPRKEV